MIGVVGNLEIERRFAYHRERNGLDPRRMSPFAKLTFGRSPHEE